MPWTVAGRCRRRRAPRRMFWRGFNDMHRGARRRQRPAIDFLPLHAFLIFTSAAQCDSWGAEASQ